MTAIPYVGMIPSSKMHGFGNTVRTQTQNEANNWMAYRTARNEGRTAEDVVLSQRLYQGGIESAANDQRRETIAGIDAGAGTALGGANRAAGTASHGVNQAYQLELQANQVQFTGTGDAATITREANFEAARDRQIGTIITSMSRDMARRLEEAGRQRY